MSLQSLALKQYIKIIIITVLFTSFTVQAEDSILFVSGSHSNATKVNLLQKESLDYGFRIVRKKAVDFNDEASALIEFDKHKLVIFDGVSSNDNKRSFERFLPYLSESKASFMAMRSRGNTYTKDINKEYIKQIATYYANGGKRNFSRLLDFFRYRVLDGNTDQSILPPVIFPTVGIYHPDHTGLIFKDRQGYFAWLEEQKRPVENSKPIIGVLIQRASIETIQTVVIDETIKRIEESGATPLAFFFELSPFSSDYSTLIQDKDKTVVDIIINFRMIHWANKRKSEFEKFGVPVLQALTYFDGDQEAWENDIQGISPGMTSFMLVLPESSGVIDPLTIATFAGAIEQGQASDDEQAAKWESIDYQLNHMINKALRMANLKYKANAEKKLTVMVWGDEDMGASFLNVPDSLHTLAHRLNQEGYDIAPHEHDFYSDRAKAILEPFYRDDRLGKKLDELIEQDLAELLPLDNYMKWFNALPEAVTKKVMDYWGHPKDSFMAVEQDGEHFLVIPRIHNGNMLVMRQPPRADDKEEAERIYHSEDVPINHFYLAGYYYAREHWKSDAIIHYGTHGSQEYLYGKERVPSMYDHPNLAVWDTPILYPFIVDDVGEAMQTKRRGRATVISHMTPPFAASGLQGELADIHNLMHEYNALDTGGVKNKTGKQIVEVCFSSGICNDMDFSRKQIAADFTAFLKQLHDYMNEISGMSQPLGLHSYGELPRKELVISTLVQMLGTDFVITAADFEKEHYQSDVHDGFHSHDGHEEHNHSHSEQDHSHDNNDEHGFHETKTELSELTGFKTVRDYIVNAPKTHSHDHDDDQHGHKHDEDHDHSNEHSHDHEPPVTLEKLSSNMQEFIKQGQTYYQNMLAMKELDNTVAFLKGEYIPVKTGGDPLRNPEALPTGLNLYGFDPARIPTKAAYEQGSELVEQIIAEYYGKHGRYPDKLAFTLWSIETMRQYGVLEAQALRAMGMRPVWSDDGRVIDSEIIPYADLKRPRVDVVLSATGLYRDAFPNIIQYLAKAVEKIAALKEEGNSIWENSQRIAEELKAEGIQAEEAQYLSTVRVFSNSPGKHGSGVDDATFASDSWEQDKEIADLFLANMGSYYGSSNDRYGKKLE
ncbi:MAG: cobaltochelatase subunit CobN, partial [Pseudomonadota bacterium]